MGTKAKLVDALISYVPEPFQWTLTTLVGCMTMTVIGSSEEYDEAEGDIRNLSEGIDYDIWDIGRQPTKAEKQHCAPHISELIETIQPHGIVLLDSTYKTKLPSLTLKLPYDKEYKLLPLLKESHKLTKFITKLYERL